MTFMNRGIVALLGGLAGVGALLVAGCGGGGSGDASAGKGQRVTDPAKVYTSTPLVNTSTFQIRNDVIIAPDGAKGSVVAGGGTPASGSKTYTVQSGDTCGSIAAQYGIAVSALLAANRTIDQNCGNLHVGDVLKIPGTTSTPTTGTGGGTSATPTPKPSGKEYKVKSGDTCDDIARSFGVDVNKLIALNGLDADCRNLQVGQTIKIP